MIPSTHDHAGGAHHAADTTGSATSDLTGTANLDKVRDIPYVP